MACARVFPSSGIESTGSAAVGEGTAGLATAITLHRTVQKSAHNHDFKDASTGMASSPRGRTMSEASGVAESPRPKHHMRDGPKKMKKDLEGKLVKRYEPHAKNVSRRRTHHRGGKMSGVGYSNTAHRLTISACKVGGLWAADPTRLKIVKPNLGISGSDLPDLRAISCRSWPDLTVWNKIQDYTAPRQQFGRNRQRLRRGRTVSDMQKNHCSFGSDPCDLVHIRA